MRLNPSAEGAGKAFDRRRWRRKGERLGAAVEVSRAIARGETSGTARGVAEQLQVPPSPPISPIMRGVIVALKLYRVSVFLVEHFYKFIRYAGNCFAAKMIIAVYNFSKVVFV